MFCALNGATDTPRRAQPPADAGDQRALARVRGRARDQQRTPHVLCRRLLGRRSHGSPGYRGHVRFLLRPGWLALIAVVVGFAVACYTLLAPWQFGREDAAGGPAAGDRRPPTRHPPVPLAELVPAGSAVTPRARVAAGDRHGHLPARRRGGGAAAGRWTAGRRSRCSPRCAPTTAGSWSSTAASRRSRTAAAVPRVRRRRRRARSPLTGAAARRRDRSAGRPIVRGRRSPGSSTPLDSRAVGATTGLRLEPGLPAAAGGATRRARPGPGRPDHRRARRSPTSPTPCSG